MTKRDDMRFARVMAALGETFNETISKVRTDAYFAALQEFDIADIEAAATNHIRVGRFFPKPVELREWITGTDDDQADAAWAELHGEFRRVGSWRAPTLSPLTQQTILALCGTWERACALIGRADSPAELQGWQKRFKETYVTMAIREHQQLAAGLPPKQIESSH